MDTTTSPVSFVPAEAVRIPALAIAAAAECITCGAGRAGPFCSHCGQRARDGRLTVRGVVTQTFTSIVDLDRGFLHTAVGLFRDPGRVVGDFVAGRTVNYTHPARYFVMLVAAVVLVFTRLKYADVSLVTMDLPEAERMNAWIAAHMNLFMAVTIPFSAGASRWIFRKAGMNYAEHLVFNLYVYGQQSVVFVVMAGLGWAVGMKGAAMLLYTLLSFVYYVWASAGTFRVGWAEALLRTVGMQMVSGLAGGVIGLGAALVFLE